MKRKNLNKGFKACSIFFYSILFIILFYSSHLHSEEILQSRAGNTTIESDILMKEGTIYHLKGNVELRDLNTVIRADSAIYDSNTNDLHLEGNIYYDDKDTTIRAEKANLNLKSKTGILINADVLFKKQGLRVISPRIERLSENHYLLRSAMVTTCEGLIPAWCFKGRDIDLIAGDRLFAKDVTFRIKGFPVFYSPYLWAPALTERKSGLLIPSITYSRDLGLSLRQPLYIVTGEHSDLTINLDVYTERGIGEGIEYRWRGYPENYIDINLYHIRDSSLKKDFSEIRLRQNMESTDEENDRYFREFMNINMVNEEDYLRIMSPFTKTRLTRFLDSTLEMSYKYPFLNLYAYGEYIQDLTYDTSTVPQRLPVAGMNIYPIALYSHSHPPYFYMESSFSNFVRDEGTGARRFYLEPGIIHSLGDTITLSQNINTKVIKYFTDSDESTDSFIEYRAGLKTAISKDYSSLRHTIEPEVSYQSTGVIEKNSSIDENNFFDTKDLFKKRSIIELSILNRFDSRQGPSRFLLRFTQPYDTESQKYQSLRTESALELDGLHAKLSADYDYYQERMETISSTAGIRLRNWNLYISERYISPDILFLSTGVKVAITKSLTVNSTMWYDMKGEGLRDITTDLTLRRQCWALNLRWIQRREDYFIGISIDLKGFIKSPLLALSPPQV